MSCNCTSTCNSCSSCSNCNCNSCNNCSCNCPSCSPCSQVCTALEVENSWNVPACDSEAVLSIPGLTTVLIGAYIFNPTYGWFRITAFDSVNGQLTVLNECFDANAAPGTVVPALTSFVFGSPPGSTNVQYTGYSVGSYTLTGVTARAVFSTTSPTIVITLPGTYLILAEITISSNGATTAGVSSFQVKLRRFNNTAADIVVNTTVAGTQGGLTTFTGTFSTAVVAPVIYTTLNSNDEIDLSANYTGSVPSVGSFQLSNASIVAIKLS